VLGEVSQRFFARPSELVNAGIDDQANGPEQLTAQPAQVALRILVEAHFFAETLRI